MLAYNYPVSVYTSTFPALRNAKQMSRSEIHFSLVRKKDPGWGGDGGLKPGLVGQKDGIAFKELVKTPT